MRKYVVLIKLLIIVPLYGKWYGTWNLIVSETLRVKPNHYKWKTIYNLYHGDSIWISFKLLNPLFTNLIDEFVFLESYIFDEYIDWWKNKGGTFDEFFEENYGYVEEAPFNLLVSRCGLTSFSRGYEIRSWKNTGVWRIGFQNEESVFGVIDIIELRVWIKRCYNY